MGILDRYKILDQVKKVTQDITPIFKETPPVIAEVILEDNRVEVTRSNSIPGVGDYLMHNISEYRREDTSVRLLPNCEILLDKLLERPKETLWDL